MMTPKNNKKNLKTHISDWLYGAHDPVAGMAPYQEDETLFHSEEPAPRTFAHRAELEYRQLHTFGRLYRALSVILCLGLIAVLLITVAQMPRFGDPDAPTNNEVARRYLEAGRAETGATNAVAGMILDYRAFDTLGETFVLFAAVCAVFILLLNDGRHKTKREMEEDAAYNVADDLIVSVTGRVLVPLVLLFGVVIVLNGHLSPGGGFSGGAIIGAGLIFYAVSFGFDRAEKFLNKRTLLVTMSAALLFYCGVKGYSFFMGANHLDSGIPLGRPGNLVSAGLIFPLNIAVGIVVACTMYALYSAFRRGRL